MFYNLPNKLRYWLADEDDICYNSLPQYLRVHYPHMLYSLSLYKSTTSIVYSYFTAATPLEEDFKYFKLK